MSPLNCWLSSHSFLHRTNRPVVWAWALVTWWIDPVPGMHLCGLNTPISSPFWRMCWKRRDREKSRHGAALGSPYIIRYTVPPQPPKLSPNYSCLWLGLMQAFPGRKVVSAIRPLPLCLLRRRSVGGEVAGSAKPFKEICLPAAQPSLPGGYGNPCLLSETFYCLKCSPWYLLHIPFQEQP